MDKQQSDQNSSSASSSVLHNTSSSPSEEELLLLPATLVDESLLLSNVLDQELGNNSNISLENIWNDLIQCVENHVPNNDNLNLHPSTIIADLEQQCQQDIMMNLNPSSFDQFASLGNDDVNMVLESLDNNNNLSNNIKSFNSDVNQNHNNIYHHNDNLVTSTSSPSPHFGHSSTISSPYSVSQTSTSSKFNTTNDSTSDEQEDDNDDDDDDYDGVQQQQQKQQGSSSERVHRKRKRESTKKKVGMIKSRGKLIYEQMKSPERKKSKSTTKKKKKKYTKTDIKKKKDNKFTTVYIKPTKLTKPDSQRVKSNTFRSSILYSHSKKSLLKPSSTRTDYVKCELEHKNQIVFQRVVKCRDGRFNIMERKRNPDFIQTGEYCKRINEFTFDKNEGDQLRKEEEEVKQLSQRPLFATKQPESLQMTTNTMNAKKIVKLVDYQISDDEEMEEEMEEGMTEQTSTTTTTIEQQKLNTTKNNDEIEIISISETSSIDDGEKSPINNSNLQSLTADTLNSPTSEDDSDIQFIVHFPAPAILNVETDQNSSGSYSDNSDGFNMKNIRIDTCTTNTAIPLTTTTTTNNDGQFIDKAALKRTLNIPNEVLTTPLSNLQDKTTAKQSDDSDDDDIRILSPVPPEEKEIEIINLSSDSETEGAGRETTQSAQNIEEQVTFIKFIRGTIKSELGMKTRRPRQ